MRDIQRHATDELRVVSEVDAAAQVRFRVDFLKEYATVSGTRGFVLGISGGQDSTLAGRLCQLASEELRASGSDAEFVAVRLPHGAQLDEADARLALAFIDADNVVTYDIAPAVEAFERAYEASLTEELRDFARGNVKARMRMIAQYAIAAQRGMLVVGTDHAAEGITGFFTKYGDGGADILPLAGLSKRQGRQLLTFLGASERLYTKPPTADLLDERPGQTDESELGLRYEEIDDYLAESRIASNVPVACASVPTASTHESGPRPRVISISCS